MYIIKYHPSTTDLNGDWKQNKKGEDTLGWGIH